jgi:hypothetical protein
MATDVFVAANRLSQIKDILAGLGSVGGGGGVNLPPVVSPVPRFVDLLAVTGNSSVVVQGNVIGNREFLEDTNRRLAATLRLQRAGAY